MDLPTAYKVLNLPSNPTFEQLEESYYTITDERLIDPKRLDQVQQAYNIMKDHINELNPPPKRTFWQKTRDFIYTYKIQLLIGIAALITIISLSYTLIIGMSEQRDLAKHPDDIKIGLFGDFDTEVNLDSVKERVHDLFPNWKEVNVHIQYAPGGPGTEPNIKADQEAWAYLMTSKPDVLILDRYYFKLYNDGTVFEKLDQLNTHNQHLLQDEDGEIVGINITNHPLFENTGIARKEKLAIIPIEASQYDNAISFFEKILDSF